MKTFYQSVTKSAFIPKVHLSAANNDLRAALNCVLVNKTNITATNSHIMVVHETKNIFEEIFIDGFPDKQFLIYSKDWKKMTSLKVTSIYWDMDDIYVLYKDGVETKIPIYYEGSNIDVPWIEEKTDLRFPNFIGVIPDLAFAKREAIHFIGINPKLLNLLQQALGDPIGVRLDFINYNKIITVTPIGNMKSKGFIMPTQP